MGKIRVYELAKELSMESKEVIRRITKMGFEVKNHMSTVDDKFADQLRQMVMPNPKKTGKSEEEKNVPAGNKVEEGKTQQNFNQQKKNAPRKPDMRHNNQNQKTRTDSRVSANQNLRDNKAHQNKEQYKSNDQNRPDGFKKNQVKHDDERTRDVAGKSGAQKQTDGIGKQAASMAFTKPGSQKNIQKQKEQKKDKGVSVRTGKLEDDQNNTSRSSSQKAGQKNLRAGGKKNQHRKNKKGHYQKTEIAPTIPKKVVIGETVTVQELAKSMSKTAVELIKVLMGLGVMVTINDEIDADTAVLIGSEVGIPVEVRLDKTMEIMEDQGDEDDESLLVERAPVVTVMGHVDHGKTSLLDAIRKAKVTATEAGGITQHIGAYQVEVNNKKITFLDTPGHEAFTAMRARGAQVTDVSIIVVASDDGVMPQTIEAINHSKAAKVPIIVAINKIDKPDGNPDRVKQELTEHGLVSEEWGGDTIMVPVSAKTHEGIDQLLEMILLVAEVSELKANPNREARGTVIEAELDKGKGPVATVLVQKGTMEIGENIVAGTTFGKVRAMIDDKGRRVKSAGPSTPVVVLGFSDVPPVGEQFVGIKEEKDARYIAEKYQLKKREEELNKSSRVSLDDLFNQISKGVVKDLNLIIKADVQGSIEALAQSLNNLSTDEVRVNIVHSGVGTITETDVMLATTANAVILGFNVRPSTHIRKIADQEKVDIKLYRVIYEAIDDVKAALSGLLDPTFKEVVIGHAEVRQTFKVPKVGVVAGCKVIDGKITRQSDVRVIRDGIVVHEGHVESLRRVKDDVKEVLSGFECGIGIENFNDIKEGDIIESYIMEETKREL